jgi:uncharacterized protein YndB with AHSA1/START domain
MTDDRTLTLLRTLDAPRSAVWRCWTEQALIPRWFCPPPWRAEAVRLDLRPGGACWIDMHGPDDAHMVNKGIYLEVVPGERLVFTDAFVDAWTPSAKPFMTGVIELSDAGQGKTRYSAAVHHWSMEDKASHEAMGFHEGWGIVADQLARTAREIA